MLEHPAITEMNRKGFIGVIEKKQNCVSDVFGDEVLEGDEIVKFNGEIILKENLREFLEEMGFVFLTA